MTTTPQQPGTQFPPQQPVEPQLTQQQPTAQFQPQQFQPQQQSGPLPPFAPPSVPSAKRYKTYTTESVLFDIVGGALVALGLVMMINTQSLFVLVFGRRCRR
jgi:hypothetical protein